MNLFNLDAFVHFAGIPFAKFILGRIFVDAYFDLIVFESVKFLKAFLLCEVARKGLILVIAALDIAAKSSHLYIAINKDYLWDNQ